VTQAMTDKKVLRKIFSQKRNALSCDEIYARSVKICNVFFNMKLYKDAEKIFTYINYKSEFAASIIAKKALEDGKRVCVPVMSGKVREMFFVEIKSFDELSKNKLGILEPKLDFIKVLKSDFETAVIVPALAFSKNGYRLGYGGGFYDKYLSENDSFFNIGFAFDFQISDEIFNDEFDVPVDIILSESEKIFVNKNLLNYN